MQTLLVHMREMTAVERVPRELWMLFMHRVFMRLGLVGLSTFSVSLLYIYTGNSLVMTGLLYAALHLVSGVLTPWSTRLIGTLGIKKMLLYATPLAILSIGSFALIETYPWAVIAVSLTSAAVYKAIYWVPYQVDMALLVDKNARGRQVALLSNGSDVLIALTPLLGGIALTQFGISASFLVGALIMSAAILPLLFIKERYESYSWGYLETFQRLFKINNRALLFGYMGDGAQSVALSVPWILFIFVLVEGRFDTLGLVSAVTLIALIMLRAATGTLFDKWDKKRVLIIGGVLNATGWLLKLFVVTPVGVFLSDTYHGAGRVSQRTSIEAVTYEQAADSGRYIDEYTALKEIALSIGRAVMLLLMSGAAFLFGFEIAITITIICAALTSLSASMLSQRISVV